VIAKLVNVHHTCMVCVHAYFLFSFGIPSQFFVWLLSSVASMATNCVLSCPHVYGLYSPHFFTNGGIDIILMCSVCYFIFRRSRVCSSFNWTAFMVEVFRGCPQSPERNNGIVTQKSASHLILNNQSLALTISLSFIILCRQIAIPVV
jgi:hypothetical protein